MSLIHEIANAVRTRRREIGLSQAALATASDLPLSTICSAEELKAPSLSVSEAEALLESIGLSLQVVTNGSRTKSTQRSAPLPRSALELAAGTASMSYTGHFSREELRQVLLDREAPHKDIRPPHLAALLDEAPMSLLARVVDEMNISSGLERGAVWARMGARPAAELRTGDLAPAARRSWGALTRRRPQAP
ncbi:helix-turn-helix domain-containing protein [Variovorax sp. LjRoot178]|uniref:helix-turn-helix domain-containing protein n=1 Tax=Variovorax sp. LjRoot178 TaxID=3342277 RepID=UPI003ECD3E5D